MTASFGRRSRRLALTLAAVAMLAACGAPQLAEPEAPAPPPEAAPAPGLADCTSEESALDAERSFAPDGPLPSLDALPAEVAAIQASGKLRVGVSGDTLQFGARNPQTRALEGFDIAVLHEVAEAIFGPGGADSIEYVVMTYAERIPALEEDRVDIVAHTMTINCRRWKVINFSSTYYDAGQKVLVKKDSGFRDVDHLIEARARVCLPAGSTNEEEMTKARYAELEILALPDSSDCVVALHEGLVDAITADDTVLVGFEAQDPNLEMVGAPITSEPYGLGIAQERVEFTKFVNAVLEEMRTSGRWTELYRQWVADTDVPAPPAAVYGREPG